MRKSQGRGLELARKHIAACLSELALILKSLEFLRFNAHGSQQDDVKCETTASGCEPIGFAANLNSRLLAPAPPRAIKLLSWIEVSSRSKRIGSFGSVSFPFFLTSLFLTGYQVFQETSP